ncbi:formylmethanofuran dehydrogenase subunit E family protein [Chthonomonas calidirosea]|uniref:formylmethanofuran dehydrogenase subunit E family protein n=1 Tax=Chthonomonas calidirosea TaxID=454171 RepID=UPI0006ECBE6F|nr:formylmethanofuran dehydrogenase subunit E family protein [Chthonomonas calidirosea]CEK14852.1 formylmethanofuran dehydrogenase subunit E [Chthonomonas calidirosea]
MNTRLLPTLVTALLCGGLVSKPLPMQAETPQEWVALGQRVHGAFGSYIALGIRIGLDALQRLHAQRTEVKVTYQSGPKAPCPCVADGIMLATIATPGRGTLRVMAAPSSQPVFGIATITDMKTEQTLRYVIPASAQAFLDRCNQYSPIKRYWAVMKADPSSLYRVTLLRPTKSTKTAPPKSHPLAHTQVQPSR